MPDINPQTRSSTAVILDELQLYGWRPFRDDPDPRQAVMLNNLLLSLKGSVCSYQGEELGLTEAFETAICVIEWPDKLGPLTPESAAKISFETDPNTTEARHLTLSWSAPKWPVKLRIPT